MTNAKGRFVWVITLVLGAVLALCTPGLAADGTVTVKGEGKGKAFKYNGAAGSISFTVTATAGTPSVDVAADTAVSALDPAPVEWISIDPASASQTVLLNSKGMGKGTVKYRVAAYTRASPSPRTGVIQVAGKLYPVSQSGVACKVTLSSASSSYPGVGGGEGEFLVTAPLGCGWTASVDEKSASWIKIGEGEGSSPVDGGSGTVAFQVLGNVTTKPRAGKVYVTPAIAKPSKKTHSVKQVKGGGPVIAGVAAAGAPIIGHVTIKDSGAPAQEKVATIAADGKYTIDVTGMTGPFALRADGVIGGREYHLYSAATLADVGGTINITPFTDLIIANIAGDIAANYFDSGNFSTLTTAEIDAKTTALREKLQPLLTAVGLDTSIDLLRTSFSTDHTKLDGLLDVVQVTVNPDTLQADIVNIVTQNTVSVDVMTGAYTGDFTDADGTSTAASLTELQKIVTGFDTFTSLFAKGLPQEDNATLLSLFDGATFLHDGQDLATFLSDPTSDPNLVGVQFTNITVISLDPVAGTGEVGFDVVMKGVVQTDAPNRFFMIKKDGKWLMQGNQHLARVQVEVHAEYWPDNLAGIETGLYLQVRDEGNKGIDYAVVTGPGLPAPGIVLVKIIQSDEFAIYDGGEWPPQNDSRLISMNDDAIDGMPAFGAEYTFSLYAAHGTLDQGDDTLLGTYKTQIRARPLKMSELSVASFATVTAPTLAAWRVFNGGTVNVTWTIPAGCYSDYVYANLWGPEGSAQAEKQPGPTTTSASLILTAKTAEGTAITVQNRNLNVNVKDEGGRDRQTHLY